MDTESADIRRYLDAKHVNVLTKDHDGSIVGYRILGAGRSPNVLVAGHSPTADRVYNKVLRSPKFQWLRGSITMVMIHALETEFDPKTFGQRARIDEFLFLPFAADRELECRAAIDGYWSVLRLCAKLGMIDGRDIPNKMRH